MLDKIRNKPIYTLGTPIGSCFYVKDIPTPEHIKDRYERFARFVCTCGKLFEARVSAVKNQNVQCKECAAKKCIENNPTRTHGQWQAKEYYIWSAMIQRCYNPNSIGYAQYGGRGIKMCDEWRHNYQAFFDFMGKRPSPNHSIERMDVNGNYCPENCKWATRQEQANNKQNSVRLTYKGQTDTLENWAIKIGMKRKTFAERYRKTYLYPDKWSINDIFEKPLKYRPTK